jgi:hypothetical protein
LLFGSVTRKAQSLLLLLSIRAAAGFAVFFNDWMDGWIGREKTIWEKSMVLAFLGFFCATGLA